VFDKQSPRLAKRPRAVTAVFLVAAAIAFALLAVPDTMGDLGEYCRWTRRLVAHGLDGAYFAASASPTDGVDGDLTAPIDYPPVFPYVLWLVGHAANWVTAGGAQQDRLMGFLIRVPFVLAHLAIGATLFTYVAREAGHRAAWLTLVVHLFNPAILFDTCYWGQADALLALLLVAVVVTATRGRLEWAWGLLVLAALLKPLAYPYFALLAVVTLKRGGLGPPLRCGAVAALTGIVLLAPFIWIGRFSEIVSWLVHQVDSMPFASANAHNLWWLVTGGLPWTPASDSFALGLSCQRVGILLFGAFLAITLAQLWRSNSTDALPLAAAATALAFFVLNTNLHENHLFVLLPLLSLVAFRHRSLRWVYGVASLTLLVNMLAHDPYLRFVVGPHIPGPRITLPSAKWVVDQILTAHFLRHGYAHVVEAERGLTTWWRMGLTVAGSAANVLLLIVWLHLQWRGWRLTESGERTRRWGLGWSLAAIGTLTLTTIPFFGKTRAFVNREYFLAHLSEAHVGGGGALRWGTFAIDGHQRWIILANPPSEASYSVALPAGARLALAAAFDPTRQWPVDICAVRFEVDVIGADRRETVFATSIDPLRAPGEPHWHGAIIDLARYGGQDVRIVFRTTGGNPGMPREGIGWVEPGFL
jgi:Gpi18-like mannosyltransferase